MSDQPSGGGIAVKLSSVVKSFPGNVQALRGVDLEIEQGEFVAITGPSGCGKSTSLNLVGALDTATSGHVCVDGRDLRTLGDLSGYRRQEVGIVFQLHNLISRQTAAANIGAAMFGTNLSVHDRQQRATDLLAKVGLQGRENRLPTELSGGERQRVAIARGLANEPKLLLADEPTGSLDSDAADLVMKLFKQVHSEGMTIMLVTHDPAVAAWAERTVEMKDGRVVATGVAAPAA